MADCWASSASKIRKFHRAKVYTATFIFTNPDPDPDPDPDPNP